MRGRISVDEAARRMGVTPQFLRLGLRAGKFPFGVAIKFEKQWRYYINPIRFEKWMTGDDLTHTIQEGGQAYES